MLEAGTLALIAGTILVAFWVAVVALVLALTVTVATGLAGAVAMLAFIDFLEGRMQ